MVWQSIESLLRDKLGLEPQAISQKGLARAIQNRMRVLGGIDQKAYLALLASDPTEWMELIDVVVVQETWFFRDSEPFAYLRKYVRDRQPPAGSQSPLRILSVPASTGEEPYSIAMTLLEAGLQSADFAIDALEISPKAVQKALVAVYGRGSFREREPSLCQRFFTETEAGYRLHAAVMERVRFVQGNLLDYPDLDVQGPYEIIFFRNLLIYLNRTARQRATEAVDSMLQAGGLLFLGYAESPQVFFPHYGLVDHPRSYAARKPAGLPKPERETGVPATPWRPAQRQVLPPASAARSRLQIKPEVQRPRRWQHALPAQAQPQASDAPLGRPVEEQNVDREAILRRAQLLADQGKLQDAAALCKELLQTEQTCPEPYFLLGVIALAQGDEELALENFNRTVYLQPDHRDALMHLSLLMEKGGLHDQARTYRQRLLRSDRRSGSEKEP